MERALILVDLQNDFLPGGALAVPKGDEVIAVANKVMKHFSLVFATQDWHPADHMSFASQHAGRKAGDAIDLNGFQQVLWPDHCVQNTRGAAFADELNFAGISYVIQKGTDRNIDSYSGFFDNNRINETLLCRLLEGKSRNLTVMGLATDYCVQFTVIDALRLGFEVSLLIEGCRAVELKAGDRMRALDKMQSLGATVMSLKNIVGVK
jgi:nicotinamidase/pyrazinamidase